MDLLEKIFLSVAHVKHHVYMNTYKFSEARVNFEDN